MVHPNQSNATLLATRTNSASVVQGIFPLVFRGLAPGKLEAWVTQCTDDRSGWQRVYAVDRLVDDHPAAGYVRDEPNAECESN